MGVLIDLTGQRFGKWTVIERDQAVKKKISIGGVDVTVVLLEALQEPA